MKAVKRYLKDNLGILIALAAMILFLCVWPATAKTFPTKTNLFNLLRQSSTNLMLACGMTMVIILGGIDLSVGSIIAMSGCFAAGAVVWGGMPEIVGLTLGVLSGLMFGLFNGAVIAWTNIPPFIVTLASMNLAKGIAYVFSGGKPIRCMTDAWKFLGAGYIAGIGVDDVHRVLPLRALPEPHPHRPPHLRGRRQQHGGEVLRHQHREGQVHRLRHQRHAGRSGRYHHRLPPVLRYLHLRRCG